MMDMEDLYKKAYNKKLMGTKMDINKKWIVDVQDISYTYEGNEEKALDGMSLKIRRGSRVAFMGANGSGKSTFFLCLNGIYRPDTGRIFIDGKPLRYSRKSLLEVRSKIGIVFQEPDNQLFSAGVYEEISFGIMNMGAEEEDARREVEKVIRELGIEPFQHRPAHALSGGQKKLVAIADILVMNPEIIILDEPSAALDPEHAKKVREIVEGLTARGITVLMATHDIDYAYAWADEIVIMRDGKVLCQGKPEEVCADRSVLEQAGLDMPSVLRLYRCLREKRMIPERSVLPRNTEELINMIGKDR